MKIQDILRASGVTRWHIVRTTKEQSLAEHLFDVMMIARTIAKVAGVQNDVEIMKAAIVHDLDEIITGDIPTPTKQKARNRGWDLNTLYKNVTGRRLQAHEEKIIKLADIIADIYWLRLHGIGEHAMMVQAELGERLAEEVEKSPQSIGIAADKVYTWVLHGEVTI